MNTSRTTFFFLRNQTVVVTDVVTVVRERVAGPHKRVAQSCLSLLEFCYLRKNAHHCYENLGFWAFH